MVQHNLSNKFTIYSGHDSAFSSNREKILSDVKLNSKYTTHFSNNSVWVEINTESFRRVNNLIHSEISKIANTELANYAEHYWVYTQTEGFDLEWMHQHILVHPQSRSTLLTDYTFTYYLQVPEDISGNEGQIVFQTEDKELHNFLPKEGDYFIFPADIRHTAIPTPKSKTDRIVYAGSICVDIHNQNTMQKACI